MFSYSLLIPLHKSNKKDIELAIKLTTNVS